MAAGGSSKAVIIVAGGSGVRMNADRPKQFLELAGKPVLLHTLRAFHTFDPTMLMVVVLPESHLAVWDQLYQKSGTEIPHQVTAGGVQRYHSVKNGLKLLDSEELVAIHDGVRPLVAHETIARTFDGAATYGAAVPVLPVDDTLREKTEDDSHWVDRGRFVRVQTPQCFKTDLLRGAYQQDYSDNFTDDASVVEQMGGRIHLVKGNVENFKITVPFHLQVAETVLAGH